MGLEVFGVGEPHVTHGAVVGLDSRVAHQMVLKLVPAVEYTAADLAEVISRVFQSAKEKTVTYSFHKIPFYASAFTELLKYNEVECKT